MKKLTYEEFIAVGAKYGWTQEMLLEQILGVMNSLHEKYNVTTYIQHTYPATDLIPSCHVLGIDIPKGVKLDFTVGFNESKNSDGDLIVVENNLTTADMIMYFNASNMTCYLHASEIINHRNFH